MLHLLLNRRMVPCLKSAFKKTGIGLGLKQTIAPGVIGELFPHARDAVERASQEFTILASSAKEHIGRGQGLLRGQFGSWLCTRTPCEKDRCFEIP
jgi:hypothetical protein